MKVLLNDEANVEYWDHTMSCTLAADFVKQC